MSIEINGPKGRPTAEIADNRKTQAKPAGDTASSRATAIGSGGQGDKFSLTSEASQLKSLEEQVSSLPVVDTKRVQEVQRSLATGSFQVDPARVADKMLQFEAGLGQDNDGDE